MKMRDWERNLAKLARREVKWQNWQPAAGIARCFNDCRDSYLPLPPMDEKVINDIVFQFRNPKAAFGSNDLNEHRERCAAALAIIGAPEAVPLIIECLQDSPGHAAWAALRYVEDERFLSIIEKNLDSLSQQDAFPAIACLSKMGRASIPVLTRILKGKDRALKRAAIDALVQIALPECLPSLRDFIAAGPSEDRKLDRKARAALATLQCRVIEKTYAPPRLVYEDECRLHHLVRMLILVDRDALGDCNRREKAAAALIKMGGSLVVAALRPQLANYSHADGPRGPRFFVSERVSNVMVRLGDVAIPALLDALNDERDHAHAFAAGALSRITGKDFGTDYTRWRKWCVDTGRIKQPSPATLPGGTHAYGKDYFKALVGRLSQAMPKEWELDVPGACALAPMHRPVGMGALIRMWPKDLRRATTGLHDGEVVIWIMSTDYDGAAKALIPVSSGGVPKEIDRWHGHRVFLWGPKTAKWPTCETDIKAALEATVVSPATQPATQPTAKSEETDGVPPFLLRRPQQGVYEMGDWRYEFRQVGQRHHGSLHFKGKPFTGAKHYDRVVTPWGALIYLGSDTGFMPIMYQTLTREELERGDDMTPPGGRPGNTRASAGRLLPLLFRDDLQELGRLGGSPHPPADRFGRKHP